MLFHVVPGCSGLFWVRECVRILDLWEQVHPGELWVSKQRVQKVMSQRSAGLCTRCTRAITHSLRVDMVGTNHDKVLSVVCDYSCAVIWLYVLYHFARFYKSMFFFCKLKYERNTNFLPNHSEEVY